MVSNIPQLLNNYDPIQIARDLLTIYNRKYYKLESILEKYTHDENIENAIKALFKPSLTSLNSCLFITEKNNELLLDCKNKKLKTLIDGIRILSTNNDEKILSNFLN